MTIDIHKLMDGMSELERDISDRAKEHRLKIISDLLTYSYVGTDINPDIIISQAYKLASFVEFGRVQEPRTVQVFKHGAVISKDTKPKPAVKRKYTKRSKFWGKKK